MKKFSELQSGDKIYVLDLHKNKLDIGTIKCIEHRYGYIVVYYFQEFIPTPYSLFIIDCDIPAINYSDVIYSTNIQSLLDTINKYENV